MNLRTSADGACASAPLQMNRPRQAGCGCDALHTPVKWCAMLTHKRVENNGSHPTVPALRDRAFAGHRNWMGRSSRIAAAGFLCQYRWYSTDQASHVTDYVPYHRCRRLAGAVDQRRRSRRRRHAGAGRPPARPPRPRATRPIDAGDQGRQGGRGAGRLCRRRALRRRHASSTCATAMCFRA